ncbi:heat-inducible transcription repressor HrcA [Caldicellulosiruptor bescii]|uniref:Heat-inducible transcription repressor HrcA n=3 Tax=Caldicellulosiruptor TaxID=44000 RepID=B9MJZ3_CALBD|nr:MULTISPECIES: heat-inducible transcriptional repressor HrcA [Caldicellulosiruptor]ACM60651.1 heat-inducible transcription repressor HrcA [Caldicellulosiruptor bescii DSM 6725]ADQ46022.1 heat-inducible transcription repressor HrcA [Caldicellulosiruptor kronotskyensis 2002]PBC88060.1 heat-inducible transcription repressor HrcA [Caldicellulosiruptor bescii]PBC90992.1 heat-inducible transcription repressor HrcA [Caldicellulosiruptor bescii]PBD03575.1 heat-inducible transcription repressor HrcA 
MLDERKRRILEAIIDDYINTGEPVGSRTIAKKYIFGISSATIRNEMSDLEEMGYLEQPHTSAGRIPSDKGYRYYVDELMKVSRLSPQQVEFIRSQLDIKFNEINEYMENIAKIISNLTNYTAVISTPNVKKSFIKYLQLVPVDTKRYILILVTNTGLVKDILLDKPENVDIKDFIYISNILNEKLSGLRLEDIDQKIVLEIENILGKNKTILSPIIENVLRTISAADSTEVVLSGIKNMFDFPEFSDVLKAKIFLHIFEQKEMLRQIINSAMHEHITIRIGTENPIEDLKECSVVLSTYRIGDSIAGSIGIIGPKRLRYSQTVSLIDYICDTLSDILTRLFTE